MRRRLLRLVRTIGISAGVLLVLVLGAGAAYTWYVGQNSSSVASVAPSEPVTTAVPQATPSHIPGPNTPASVSIQQLTSPTAPGSTVDLTARSNPTATCKIAVEYSNKQPEADAALVEKATDDYGMVSWRWMVAKAAPQGKGAVTITCSLDEKRTAVVKADLDITQ